MTTPRPLVRRGGRLHGLLRRAKVTWLAATAPLRRTLTIARWNAGGRPSPPPPPVKQAVVRGYGRRLGLNVLVETGTYLGEMLEAQRGNFARLWSIELDPDLFAAATAKFATSRHVTILQGDSAKVLPGILDSLDGPALFWLDGHYSGEGTALGDGPTPVRAELEAILSTPWDHCVLIDDARCFGRDEGYPTIEELREICVRQKPDWHFAVKGDIVRFHPPLGTKGARESSR